MKVLVLEDDTGVGKILTQCLAMWNHDVILTQDTAKAWDKLQSENFDLLIADWALPGTTGTEFVRKLRHEPRYVQLPVLMISGRAEKADIVEAVRAGANGFLPKPFTPKQLLAKMQVIDRLQSNALAPDQLQSIINDQIAEASECDALVIIGEPAPSVNALLRIDRHTIARYLIHLKAALDRAETQIPSRHLGYMISPNTHEIATLLQKPGIRLRTKLVIVSTDCVGNSFSLARSLGTNQSRNYGIVLVCGANASYSKEDHIAFGRLGVEIYKRTHLDAPLLDSLLTKHLSDPKDDAVQT
jgi:DNA-binding response OmpR family regulator